MALCKVKRTIKLGIYLIKKGISASPVQLPANSDLKNIKPIITYTSRNVLSARTLFSNEKRTRVGQNVSRNTPANSISQPFLLFTFFHILRDLKSVILIDILPLNFVSPLDFLTQYDHCIFPVNNYVCLCLTILR